jgi:MFS family permease
MAANAGELVGARLAQGLGAAFMLPAALSLLTTSFAEGQERNTALGVWGGVAGLASAIGVFLGGVITEGPGWRWVLFVNPLVAVALLGAIFRLIPADAPRVRTSRSGRFDVIGSVLVTAGMLLLVYALVKAPNQGWGSARTIGELVVAAGLLLAFLLNEQRGSNPLIPLSTFRIPGLAAADATMLIAAAGLISMFFFLTLYMQNVLGYSPLQTGAAYLPFTAGVAVAAGISSQLMAKFGTRPFIVVGSLVAGGGIYMLSHLGTNGSYVSDLLPGLLVGSLGLGMMFVAVTTAANAGVPPSIAGLAAALLNSSQQVGAALGLAIFSAVATARTNDLLAAHSSVPHALTAGFQRALVAESLFLVGAGLIGLRTKNAHDQELPPLPEPRPEAVEAVELT